MEWMEPVSLPEASVSFSVRRLPEDRAETQALISEHVLALYVNGGLFTELVCTPTLLPELVLGRLLSEGLVSGLQDVRRIGFSEEGRRADVVLTEPAGAAEPAPLTPVPFQWEWIARMSETLRSRPPLHRATYGTHSCILMRDGEILHCCEDMGRHNAMDKAIGWALRRRICLGACILFVSCRVPKDMVWKAIRAGVPVLASKSLPTAQAVALAKAYRLTLAGHAYPDGIKVFHDGS